MCRSELAVALPGSVELLKRHFSYFKLCVELLDYFFFKLNFLSFFFFLSKMGEELLTLWQTYLTVSFQGLVKTATATSIDKVSEIVNFSKTYQRFCSNNISLLKHL